MSCLSVEEECLFQDIINRFSEAIDAYDGLIEEYEEDEAA